VATAVYRVGGGSKGGRFCWRTRARIAVFSSSSLRQDFTRQYKCLLLLEEHLETVCGALDVLGVERWQTDGTFLPANSPGYSEHLDGIAPLSHSCDIPAVVLKRNAGINNGKTLR